MARIVEHLSVAELEERYRAARDATEARHIQAVWLLAQGRAVLDGAGVLAFAPRWVEQLAARHDAHGPAVLGDQRRRNGRAASVLTAAVLAAPAERRRAPPDDGGGAGRPLFSPPRLEIMLFQQHPDGLPADTGNEMALHRFLGDQPHAPAGPPLGRRAADHGHDTLRLPRAECRLVPRPRLLPALFARL